MTSGYAAARRAATRSQKRRWPRRRERTTRRSRATERGTGVDGRGRGRERRVERTAAQATEQVRRRFAPGAPLERHLDALGDGVRAGPLEPVPGRRLAPDHREGDPAEAR